MKIKEFILLMIKGAIIGIANIIPGVSGGTLALSLGIYEPILNILSNVFKNFKKNLIFMIPIVIGAALGILLSSKGITYALKNYQAQTIFLFMGLITGGMPIIMNKVKGKGKISNVLIGLLVIAFVLLFNFSSFSLPSISLQSLNIADYLFLLLVGVVASSAMVIPGISGSFVLMMLGYYERIVGVVGDLTNFDNLGYNLSVLIPFGIGCLIGLVLISKLILALLKKNEIKTYFGIIGFIVGSMIILLLQIKLFDFNIMNILTCAVTFILGYYASYIISKK